VFSGRGIDPEGVPMSDIPSDDRLEDDDLVIEPSDDYSLAPEVPVSESGVGESPSGEVVAVTDQEPAGDRCADGFKRITFVMSHYRDTYRILRRHGKTRDRLFFYILILLVLIAIDGLSRGTISKVINGYVETHLVGNREEWQKLDFTAIIHLLVDFCLLSLVVKYYQRTILTTRMYNYLIMLEEQLCEWLGGPYVTRHGKAYFSRRGVPNPNKKERQPCFLRFARLVYDGVFPLALGALAIWMFLAYVPAFEALGQHIRTLTYDPATIKSTVTQAGSGICTLAIAFSSLLYLVWVAFRR